MVELVQGDEIGLLARGAAPAGRPVVPPLAWWASVPALVELEPTGDGLGCLVRSRADTGLGMGRIEIRVRGANGAPLAWFSLRISPPPEPDPQPPSPSPSPIPSRSSSTKPGPGRD